MAQQFWAIRIQEHAIATPYYIGWFSDHWTKSASLAGAALFPSVDEAENAKQALDAAAEAFFAVSPGSTRRREFWTGVHGAYRVEIVEVEIVTRLAHGGASVD